MWRFFLAWTVVVVTVAATFCGVFLFCISVGRVLVLRSGFNPTFAACVAIFGSVVASIFVMRMCISCALVGIYGQNSYSASTMSRFSGCVCTLTACGVSVLFVIAQWGSRNSTDMVVGYPLGAAALFVCSWAVVYLVRRRSFVGSTGGGQ